MSTKKLQIIGNFGGNSIEIDDTLTRIGHAADAKATGDAINQLQANVDNVANIVNNLDDTHYTESEIDSMMTDLNAAIDAKSDSNHIHDDLYYTETEIDAKLGTIQSDLDSKVDAEDGKGLSTNDYTDEEQQKLRDIESGANYYEHPAHSSHDLGLYKVIVDGEGHVSGATAVEKEDILAFVEKDDIVNLGFMDEDGVSSEISDLNDRIDGVEGDLNTTNETLNGLSEEFESYKTTNNEAVATNTSGIEANKTAIEEIKDDYLTSTDKTQLQDGISQVSEKATANATAIEILNGEGNGSVKQSIDNAFNEFAAKISDDKVVNTYKELIDYADEHGAEFTTLVGNVANISDRVGDVESDLSDYKTTVSNQFAEIDTMIDNHINDTQEALQGKADSEHMHEIGHIDSLQDLLDELRTDIDTNAEDIDTKANLEHEHSDLYYNKDEIEELVTVEDIDDICGSNVIIGGGDANVVSYATKQWVQDGYQPKGNYLTSVPDGYATESYVNTKIAAIPTPDVSGQINTHNLATDAHNDIRLLVDGLTTRLNTLADCDDTTLDQMSEVVEYIKSNQSLIEGITTKKVNVADIIDNLTTNVSNKPLSAAQGAVLNGLIEELTSNLSNYQPKGDYLTAVPAGYATEEFVTTKIAEAELGGEPGSDGKSAYAYAQDAGYTGTEEEFAEKLAAGSLSVSLYNATDEGVFDADHTPDECGKAFSDGVAIYVNAVYENREYAGPVCTVLLEEDGFCVVTANLFNLDNAADMMSVIGYTDEGWVLAAPPVTYASTADIPDVAPFVITVTGNDTDGYTLDKTGEEIEAAYAAGRRLCCNLRNGVSTLIDALPLFYRNTIRMPINEGFVVTKYVYSFKYMSGGSTTTVSFDVGRGDNKVTSIKVETKNNYNEFPLTINDQEYDGSKAVTVDTRGFTFNATGNRENGYTINTTYDAIFMHLAQGRSVNCLFNGEFFVGFILPLLMLDVENEAIMFGSSPMPGTSVMLSIMSDGRVGGEEIFSAIQIGEQYYDFYGDADFTDTINGMIDANVENRKLAKKAQGIFYIVGDSTTAGVWTGTSQEITEYFDGLTVAYKINIAGVSGGSTLNINGLGAIPVKRNADTAVTTTYPAGSVILLTYSEGSWLTADYDANTKNTTGTSNKAATKLFLTGATSQTSSGTTTYSNKNCYIGTDNCLYSNGKRTVTLDDTLKNPCKLILTGAVHAEYDGSEAITVEIPSGGNAETETVLSDNLLDKSLLTSGQCFYYGSSGYQLASQEHGYYGFIPLRGAGTYRTKFQASMHSSTRTRIALCDDNNAFVVNATGTLGEITDDNNWVDFEFVVTTAMIASGVTKVAFDVYTLFMDQTMIVKDREYPSEYIPYGYIEVATDSGKKQDNVLCGKTAVFLGDSICAGTTVGDIAEYGYGWAGLIGEANHMNWTNYGKNGGTITHRGSDGTCIAKIADRAISEHPTADYIIFEGGCNDADQMKESGLGEISTDYATFDTTTFSGALESLILKLVTAYPYARIGYIIPPKMYTGYADYTAANHIHRKYFDRAVEICQKWGIPVVDLWNGSPLNPKLSTANIYYSDGIQHLTLAGYQRITPQIEAFMRNL